MNQISTEDISCKCKCKFDCRKCNSNQKWNNDTVDNDVDVSLKYVIYNFIWNLALCLIRVMKLFKKQKQFHQI